MGFRLGWDPLQMPSPGGRTRSRATAAHLVGMRLASDTTPAPDLASDETWLGAGIDFVHMFCESGNGSSTWAQNLAIVQGLVSSYAGINRCYDWAFPLCSTSEPLSETVAGLHDGVILQMAQAIAAFDKSTSFIPVRIGWEFPYASAYPWSSQGKEALYVTAFRRVALLLKSIDPRFAIQWIGCPQQIVNGNPYDPTPAYPGDDVVDIVGMDCYWVASDFSTFSGTQAFYYRRTNPFSLDWYYNFAQAHSKLFSTPEWGLAADQPDCMNAFAEWLRPKVVSHHGYWNKGVTGDSGVFICRITNDQYPGLSAAYRAQFAVPSVTSSASITGNGNGSVSTTVTGSKTYPTFSIAGGADAANFVIDPASGLLTSKTPFATGAIANVTVKVTDERGLSGTKALTIKIPAGSAGAARTTANVVALAF